MVLEISKGVWKDTVKGVKGASPSFEKNSKAIIHFRTYTTSHAKDVDPDPDNVIDDTREMGIGPFELLVGREFKLSIWENMVKTMKVGEIARFGCEFMHVLDYGSVSKALRHIMKKNRGEQVDDHVHHQCGFSAMNSGTGYKDLDDLVSSKSPLLFEFELLRLDDVSNYKREAWQLTSEEKIKVVPKLKEEGNSLYKKGRHLEASEKYQEALGCMEQLLTMEKPDSDEWRELQSLRIPLLLNYCQCKLLQEDYAEVIRQTTSVLEYDADNVKGLFRRAKANSAMWNVKEAKEDFERVALLDPKLMSTVQKELQVLSSAVKQSEAKEKEQLSKIKLF